MKLAQRAEQRVGEHQKGCESHTDDGQGVKQTGDDKHTHLQDTGHLGLASDTFQKLAAQQAKADAGADSREGENQSDGRWR